MVRLVTMVALLSGLAGEVGRCREENLISSKREVVEWFGGFNPISARRRARGADLGPYRKARIREEIFVLPRFIQTKLLVFLFPLCSIINRSSALSSLFGFESVDGTVLVACSILSHSKRKNGRMSSEGVLRSSGGGGQ